MYSEGQLHAARSSNPTTIVKGAPGSGKTTALALRVCELVRNGATGNDIMVVVPCRSGRDAFAKALSRIWQTCSFNDEQAPSIADIAVFTIHDLAEQVLSSQKTSEEPDSRPSAHAPRMLTSFERAFLDEDLKTLGILPKRLREMLKFLEKGFTQFADDSPDFLIMAEEVLVVDLLNELLAERDAMLPSQAASLAVRHLRSHNSPIGVPHVIVDDWTSLNLASQTLVLATCTKTITVSGYQNDPGVPQEPYAHPSFDLVDSRGDNPLHVTLATPQADGQPSILDVIWDFPKDEFAGIASWVARQIDAGERPDSIAIVAPNRPWGLRMAKALDDAGVRVTCSLDEHGLPGNPRNSSLTGGQRAFALLGLVANRHDVLCWRSIVGFGDHLLGSPVWKNLRAFAGERQLGIADALLGLSRHIEERDNAEPFPHAIDLVRLVDDTCAVLDEFAGLSGQKLLDGLELLCGADAQGRLSGLLGPIEGCPDAAALSTRAREQAVDPRAAQDRVPAVSVGIATSFVGTSVKTVVIGGLIDGFCPSHACFNDRVAPDALQRQLDRERQLFDRALSIGTARCILSRFEREWLFDAEPARMEVQRVSAHPDGRLASIKPSTFLRELESTRGCVPSKGLLAP